MKRMKAEFNMTINELFLDWTFMILPTIFVKRTISLSNEDNVVIVGLQWMVFQALFVFTTKREQIPLGEVNVRVE